MKLPLREPEHEALRAELARWDGYVASALLAVEAIRACARYGEEYAARAASLEPPALRTLDAIHLATALTIAGDVGVLIAYDDLLRAAAAAHGLPVAAPGGD